MPGRRRAVTWAVGLAVTALALTLPLYASGSGLFLWETIAVQILFAVSVNVLLGYADIPSFGQAAYFGIGAYITALMAQHGLPTPVVVLAGTTCGGLAAAAAGLVTVRATGIAFSMLTLAIAQGVYTLVFHAPVLGGENGIPAISRVDLGPIELSRNRVYWYLLVACVAAGIAGYRVVIGSPFGHALQAIREDPRRAAFLGLDLRMYRVAAFTLAGFGAGLAGSLFAYASQIVTPEVMYWTQSGNPIIMALIGGMHSFYGPALGAVIFTYLLHELGHVTPAFNVYLGLVFLGFLIFLPGGAVSAPAVARTLLRRAFARVGRERKARP